MSDVTPMRTPAESALIAAFPAARKNLPGNSTVIAMREAAFNRFEAKGLDYGGKLRLAELAVASPTDLLEVVCRNQEGRFETKLVRPLRLEKQGGEALLFAEDLETRQPFQALVSRLSQVRKIKGSLLT